MSPQKSTSSDRGAPAVSNSTSFSTSSSGSSSTSSTSKTSEVKDNLSKVAPAPTEGDDDKKSGEHEGKNPGNAGGHQTLRQKAMDTLKENPSQLGDPVSLKAETADSEPTDQDRGAAAAKRAEKSKL